MPEKRKYTKFVLISKHGLYEVNVSEDFKFLIIEFTCHLNIPMRPVLWNLNCPFANPNYIEETNCFYEQD